MQIAQILQVVIAAGLINVWIFRFNKSTQYRGGSAKNMKQEFEAYGLPPWMHIVVGGLKLAASAVFIAALFFPVGMAVKIASAVIVGLMIGALAMHIKIKDPISKSVPALAMLSMAALLFIMSPTV
jgi:uncharacterized membrane protein YphA (DoxX/SURF4 family)